MVSDTVLSVDDMLARSAANVKAGKITANMSAVQKLLAQRDTPIEDTVELSPVGKILEKQKQDAEKITNYFESDDYLQLKVQQLRGQLALYSSVPGLDANGAVMAGIEAEIKDIIEQQQARLQESLKKGEEAEARLKEQEAAKAAAPTSAEDMLARVRGESPKEALSDAAQKLLDKVKGSNVNTTA